MRNPRVPVSLVALVSLGCVVMPTDNYTIVFSLQSLDFSVFCILPSVIRYQMPVAVSVSGALRTT